MSQNNITITGNLAADPEVRFTQGGKSVANLTIVSTPRTYSRQSGDWEDGTPLYMRGTLWGDAAERAADELSKGSRVIATGKLKQNNYEKDGQKRYSIDLEIEELGASLRFRRQGSNPKPRTEDPWGDDEPPF